MFTEKPLSSIPCSIPPEISIPNSPTSSTSASPLSSAAHSRTSTITSNSCKRSGVLSSHQSNRQMKIGKYFLERTIGKGSFAVVKLATHCDTHQKVAIKIIDKSCLNPNDHKKLEREIAVMKSLIHPYIIRLYEVMESKNLIYLVTEYAANGELLDLLIREKRLSEAKAKEKFRQLVLAVEYIHSKNIVHRMLKINTMIMFSYLYICIYYSNLGDLKTENLLLDGHGNIKVADFGFANTFKPNTKLQTFCGSPPYAAPELFQCLPYSPEKVDVWSLGVLLYVFVCGHLPFDSNNVTELRKRVLAGQFRLPFYLSSDCSSLISHMLTVDPEQRYTINDIKNHSWLMLNNSNISDITSQTQSIPNNQVTNAILDHAESLGYNRTQILKSVNGNSYDSDAAIWHLLLEKFQQTCQINNSHIPNNEINHVELDEYHRDLVYCPSNNNETLHSCDPDIHIDDLDNYTDEEDDDEETTRQIHDEYAQTHGLRRHTLVRPHLFVHNEVNPALTSCVRYAYQTANIEPSLLTNRLNHLQQQQQYDTLIRPDDDNDECYSEPQISIYHQRNPHSTSYNGLSVQSTVAAVSENYYQQQKNNNWLSPPILNNFHLNRRASDSGAHLLLFQQQQQNVTGSNTIHPVQFTHIKTPVSNQSSRGSITRGAPITPPIFTMTPHETNEHDDDEDVEILTRYLNRGKRHTVCEQGLLLGGKTRRGIRETAKDRSSLSRRASDTSSNFINSSTKAHLEGLYHNAVDSKLHRDDDVTTSSLQELHQLQKQIQKYSINNNNESPITIRRGSAVPSPTNSTILHIIREEHQQNPFVSMNKQTKSSSSSSSSEGLYNLDKDEYEMDYDVNTQHLQPQLKPQQHFIRPPYRLHRPPYHPRIPASYYCNMNPLHAQHLAMPTTTSYIP
ncbi:unnamed protein product [Rotaria sp. Silwood1]|nr:unnamed protein product [Rotaria sp. Silwood1]CAF1418421.1 unnamed protein product [Rotaria sp. Silwood1]CAF3654393.1 unnamed protein product [Rotaria sp. Silwood1]CAF4751291.1 unnamed protein product [Rotaria sp. Silwood1]